MKVGELVHLPNATGTGPLCGKVSALALSVECTVAVEVLTCVDCGLAMLQAQTMASSALAQRVGYLVDKAADRIMGLRK